jgi:hypothetical protein
VATAKASAIVYSLMLTCRACNVEPYAYLVHVLTELPQRAPDADVTDLLPFNFASRSSRLQHASPLDSTRALARMSSIDAVSCGAISQPSRDINSVR